MFETTSVLAQEPANQQNAVLIKEALLLEKLIAISTADDENTLLLISEVIKFYVEEYAKEQVFFIDDEEYQNKRDEIIAKLADLLMTKLKSMESSKLKAQVLECLYFLTSYSFKMNGQEVKNYIRDVARLKEAALLNALLHRSSPIGITTHSIIDDEKATFLKLSENEKIEILPELIDGITFHSIQLAKISGFEDLRTGNETIFWILRLLKTNHKLLSKNSEALQKIVAATSSYEKFCVDHQDEISSGHPSHGTTKTIVETLTELYSIDEENTKFANTDLINFLKILYANKVLRFGYEKNLSYLHEPFINLVRILAYNEEDFVAEAKEFAN
jgi:hypothetical protein